MAIAHAGSATSAGNGTTLSSPSITPANDEVMAIFVAMKVAQSGNPSLAGGSLTYTHRLELDHASDDHELHAYTAHVTGSPGAFTVDITADTTGKLWIIIERFTGVDTASILDATGSHELAGNRKNINSSVTTNNANSAVVSCVFWDTAGQPADGDQDASATFLSGEESTDGLSADRHGGGTAWEIQVSAGSNSQNWNWGVFKSEPGIINMALNESAGAPAATSRIFVPSSYKQLLARH